MLFNRCLLNSNLGFKAILFTVLFFSANVYAQNTPPSAYSASSPVNYVRTWTATAPQTNAATLIADGSLYDVKQTTSYYDGFGRPMQTVAKQASPLGNDMVTANCYDPTTGNEIYKYLPFTSNAATSGDITNDGNFKLDRFQQQVAFYNNYLTGQPNETNVGASSANWAYSLANYEASPMDRPLNSYGPGASWVGNPTSTPTHNVQQGYMVNTAVDNVQIWNIPAWSISSPENNIIPTNGGIYGAGTLYKTMATDEQGNQTIEFKDTYGQVVLKKVQLVTANADPGTGSSYTGWLSTYYVYDDHGNLRFVITPNVVSQMFNAGSWVISQSQADELCYRYEYDQLGHMIIKKNPGTPTGAQGEVWMVYDQRNRMVMEQDGNMRSLKKWQYIQYDNLDRPIAKGLITDLSYYSSLSYHVGYAATSSNTSAGVSAWPILTNYTSELLVQTFYDNYSSTPTTLPQAIDVSTNGSGNSTAFTSSYNASPTYAQPITQSAMTQGLVTGTNLEVLGTNGGQYIPMVSFYDEKGRVIQTQTLNYTKGKDIVTTQYSWSGETLSTLMSHNYSSTSNPQTHLLITAITYDAMGRSQTITKTINSTVNGVALTTPFTNSTTIVTCSYDEMGRLKNKQLGSNLDNLAYTYNVRGWLLNINPAYISGSSSSNYFGLELGYDKSNYSLAPNNSYSYPIFNGNIAGTTWRSKGDGIARKYDISYDNSNRMTAAIYNQNTAGTTWDNGYIDFTVTGANAGPIAYDANGNIQAMNQNGFAQGGKIPIDQLSYNYINGAGNSNRLVYVNDGANVTNSSLGDFHFPGAAKTSSSVDYTYDADANTISDANRSISSISYYSFPSLPQMITTINGANTNTITYFYDAAGNKLRKQVYETGVTIPTIVVNNVVLTNVATNITTTTTYINGFVYKTVYYSAGSLSPLNSINTDILQFIGVEDGRLRFKPALGTIPMSFVHDYFERDQLGNVRVALTDETQQDIYPAATGETTPVTVNGFPSDAQNYESLYYSFSPGDFVATSTLGAWYTNMLTNSGNILNENNSGIPVNNDPYSVPASQSQEVFQISGNTAVNPSGHNFGLGITLKVMAGDNINILGTSFWHNIGNLPLGGFPVNSVLTSLLTAFAGSAAVTSTISHSVLDGSAFNTSAAGPTASLLSPMLPTSPIQSGTQAPYAGINWIVFDDQFKPQGTTVGIDLVKTTSDVERNHNINVPISKNGYIYIYVSNQSPINVYFDNLQVMQTRGPLLEEAHYYPSGLLMAAISDRAWNKQPNNFHFQGKEIQDQEWSNGTGLEEYDFGSRFYDQQIGRWNTQDPASQFASPYLGMGDNWPNGTDPNGSFFGIDDAIYAGVGGLINLGEQLFSGNVHNVWQGIEDFGVGAAAGLTFEYAGPVFSGMVAGAGDAAINHQNITVGAAFGGLAGGAGQAFGGVAAQIGAGNSGIGFGQLQKWAVSGAIGTVGKAIVSDATSSGGLSASQIWKSAVSGAVLGVLDGYLGSDVDDGGYGLKSTHIGSFAYADIISITNSIGSNWANGQPLLSKINLALGPVTITLGKGQTLFQVGNNISLLANAGNYLIGAISGNNATWGFTSSAAIWSYGSVFGNYDQNTHMFTSGVLGWSNSIWGGNNLGKSKILGNILTGLVDPSLGNVPSPWTAIDDAW